MITLGIDPGQYTHGAAKWDGERVLWSSDSVTTDDLIDRLDSDPPGRVVIERVRSYQTAGNSYLETAEHIGRLMEACRARGLPYVLITRLQVVAALDLKHIPNAKRDSAIAKLLREDFHVGPKGTKREPGPTYGLKVKHEMQALAVAYVVHGALAAAADLVHG